MMKYFLIVFFTILILLISSCSKDDTEVQCINENTESNYTHFEGNFLTEVNYSYFYSSSYEQIAYDRVIRLSVCNDSLCVLHHKFPIESSDQFEFFLDTIIGSEAQHRLELAFGNNYNSITLTSDWLPMTQAPSINYSYEGTRTDLAESVLPHAYLEELEGEYNLTYWYSNYQEQDFFDLSGTHNVSKSGSNMLIGDDQYTFPLFHSWVDGVSSFPEVDDKREFSIYWENDSLHLLDLSTQGAWDIIDSTRNEIFGTKTE